MTGGPAWSVRGGRCARGAERAGLGCGARGAGPGCVGCLRWASVIAGPARAAERNGPWGEGVATVRVETGLRAG
jgi:hypothetical protein